jgi:hypothetical protein
MVNGFDTIKRDVGDSANSYDFMFDFNTGTKAAPVWVNVPEMTGLAPQHAPKNKDAAVYADQGADNLLKTGSSFTLNFNMLKKRDETGEFQASWLALKQAADGIGKANNMEIRYYDVRGASDAYQGTVSVSRGSRPNTGNDEFGWENFEFASVGPVLPIANPLKTPGAGA